MTLLKNLLFRIYILSDIYNISLLQTRISVISVHGTQSMVTEAFLSENSQSSSKYPKPDVKLIIGKNVLLQIYTELLYLCYMLS